jgi:hypothetical protein
MKTGYVDGHEGIEAIQEVMSSPTWKMTAMCSIPRTVTSFAILRIKPFAADFIPAGEC